MSLPYEWIVDGLVRASLGLAVSALLVGALIRCLRPGAPRVEQLAWAMVLVQGLVLAPFTISVPYAPAPTSAAWHPTAQQAPSGLSADSEPAVMVHNPAYEAASPDANLSSSPSSSPAVAAAAAKEMTARPFLRISWRGIVLVTWLAGTAGLIGLGWLRYRAFIRQLNSGREAPLEWQSQWQQVLREEGVSRSIPMRITVDIGPALCRVPAGYRLAVPNRLWANLSPAQRQAILRHELAHFRHGDIWKSLLARTIALVHWFNPLAWWAVARLETQFEFACDRAGAGDDPAGYAEALIQLGTTGRTGLVVAPSAGNRRLVERIRRLLGSVPPSSLPRSIATLVVAGVLLAPTAIQFRAFALAGPAETSERPAQDRTDAPSSPTAAPLLQIGTDNLRIRNSISDIAFSPKGDLIAAAQMNGNQPRAWVFDVPSGRLRSGIVVQEEPPGWITSLAFSPDQEKLLWGEITGNVALWDLKRNRLLFREQLHLRGVNDVSFSTSGEWIASAGEDGIIHMRRTADPEKPLKSFATGNQLIPGSMGPAHISGARCVAFTPDDARLIAGAGATGDISIWQIEDGRLLRQIKRAHGGEGRSFGPVLNGLTVTPDGTKIMSWGHRTVPIGETSIEFGARNVKLAEVRLWDIETGRHVKDLHGEEDYGGGYAALSRDGRRLALGEYSQLRIVDGDTGTTQTTISLPGSWGSQPTFSPDGKIVAMALYNRIGLFDAKTGKRLLQDEEEPSYPCVAVAWSPSADRIITGHGDGGVRVWDAKTGWLVWRQTLAPVISRSGWHSNPVFATYSGDGRRIVVAGRRDDPVEYEDGIVAVYNAADGRLVRSMFQHEICQAALSTDGKLLVAASSHGSANDTHLHGYDLDTGKLLYTVPPKDVRVGFWQIIAIQFRPDSTLLDLACDDGHVLCVDGTTGEETARFLADWRSEEQLQKKRPRRPDMWEAAFSLDNTTLVSSSAEYVYLWDVAAGKLRKRIRHPHDHGCRIAVAPNGKIFATSDTNYAGDYGDDTIRFYDLESGELLTTAEPNDRRPGVMAFSPDSTKLLTGSFRGTVSVWDVRLP